MPVTSVDRLIAEMRELIGRTDLISHSVSYTFNGTDPVMVAPNNPLRWAIWWDNRSGTNEFVFPGYPQHFAGRFHVDDGADPIYFYWTIHLSIVPGQWWASSAVGGANTIRYHELVLH